MEYREARWGVELGLGLGLGFWKGDECEKMGMVRVREVLGRVILERKKQRAIEFGGLGFREFGAVEDFGAKMLEKKKKKSRSDS